MIRASHLRDAATIFKAGCYAGTGPLPSTPPSLPSIPFLQSLPDATTPSLPPDHDQHYHILMSRYPCKTCRGEYVRGYPVSQAGRRAGISPSYGAQAHGIPSLPGLPGAEPARYGRRASLSGCK
ncbi:hypothetical protein HaLaN_09093 [Haematococcus lacustris]|uniref:Uncharacterized protein n=1 Tax=Haematococcus lacustris TaxID=44745 RepID=A0A699Z2M3_HAELA|nr:hypothetical protein HaLaN_09093 [Haematococcus lacustris]